MVHSLWHFRNAVIANRIDMDWAFSPRKRTRMAKFELRRSLIARAKAVTRVLFLRNRATWAPIAKLSTTS